MAGHKYGLQGAVGQQELLALFPSGPSLAGAGERPERDEETLERFRSRFLWGVSGPSHGPQSGDTLALSLQPQGIRLYREVRERPPVCWDILWEGTL